MDDFTYLFTVETYHLPSLILVLILSFVRLHQLFLPGVNDQTASQPHLLKTTPVLNAVGLTKSFGDFRANDLVSFSIQSGEIHALLGENGAGKSTFVKLVYGLLQPDEGQIFWQGQPVHISGPCKRASSALAWCSNIFHFSSH